MACGQPDQETGLADSGREVFLRYCATCHGGNGEGRPPAFPPMTDPAWNGLPAEALALIALYGIQGEIEAGGQTYRGFMPPMQHISDADIAAAIGFVKTQWGGGESTLDAASVAELRETIGRRSPWRGKDEIIEALEATGS